MLRSLSDVNRKKKEKKKQNTTYNNETIKPTWSSRTRRFMRYALGSMSATLNTTYYLHNMYIYMSVCLCLRLSLIRGVFFCVFVCLYVYARCKKYTAVLAVRAAFWARLFTHLCSILYCIMYLYVALCWKRARVTKRHTHFSHLCVQIIRHSVVSLVYVLPVYVSWWLS